MQNINETLKVIHEDEDIIVVIKPAGMLSQKDLTNSTNVYDEVCRMTGKPSVGLIQRLDRPVGGLMVLAKSDEANKKLTTAITERTIKKNYLAAVCGIAKGEATLRNYIQKVRGNRAIVSNKKTALSKEAVLHYTCISNAHIDGSDYSLLDVELMTGRFHQIRAQLSHNKLAIVGDTKYNGAYKDFRGWVNIGLYAHRLEFEHPVSGKMMAFSVKPEYSPFKLFDF